MMSHSPARFITCVIVAFVTYTQGLQFSMDTIPDNVSCGQLYCWIDAGITDTNISSIIDLTIYYVTQVNISVKLASLSIFGSTLDVQKTQIIVRNASGNISKYQAELTLALGDTSYCRNVSFLCELHFMNARDDATVIQKTVSPGASKNCQEIEKENAELRNVKAEVEKENAELKNEIGVLKTELSRLQELVNSSHDTDQVTCVKGMPHKSSREKFLLWDKVPALCDTETDGGGWIVIHRRAKENVDFYRGWTDYKNGFGTPDTDFWIGNDVIHNLTSQGYTELRVDMEYNGTQYFAHYSHFDVAAETSLYRLSVSGYSGTAGNALRDNDGNNFTTFDQDHDHYAGNCASHNDYHGAWWYSTSCGWSNLNGRWGTAGSTSFLWFGENGWMNVFVSEMKVRHQ